MKTTKNAYLAKLTEQIQMKSVNVGKNLEGTPLPQYLSADGPILKSMPDL